MIFSDGSRPFPGRSRATFLPDRIFWLTGQRARRPGKCPRPLRAGVYLPAEGPSARLISAHGSRQFPGRSRALFLPERKFSLTSQCERRRRKLTRPPRAGGYLPAEGSSVRLIFSGGSRPFPGRARAMFLPERNFSLTSQRKRRPRNIPHPLRDVGDLLADGQSVRLIFQTDAGHFLSDRWPCFYLGAIFR